MPDDSCNCNNAPARRETAADRSAGADRTVGRPLADPSVLDSELPRDVRVALGRLLGDEPVETFEDWTSEVRTRCGGGAISIDDLCHAGGKTPHLGRTDGETYYFQCFYDAVILSALTETPVDVRTESPDGTVIEARAAGTTDLTVTPESAVFSFGVDETAGPPPDGVPSHADIYEAVCPYVRAFPRPKAYERWAQTVPAATVMLPLAGATKIAATLVE